MKSPEPQNIRNIAVVAHVDHGKTTLVDALLKQSHIFRENQKVGEFIMDSNELERERGITIMAKNTAIVYRDIKINIIDTPGHADFSGEVERVINMADGVLLVVDAVDGPMPQTRYVLRQALQKHLKPVVIINKIDRSAARVPEVLNMIQDLFLELAVDADQLDFPVLYAAAKEGYALNRMEDPPKNIEPVFEAIINHVPAPRGNAQEPFQVQAAALDYDLHLGSIAIGRIVRGQISPGTRLCLIHDGQAPVPFAVTRVYLFQGLGKFEAEVASAGDIVALCGMDDVSIGDTITDPSAPESLPTITIQPPTVKMTFGINTSTLGGTEGKFCTSPQLRARLFREPRTNVSLRVEDTDYAEEFLVSGRGELHLAILIETMRREGYEFQVSKPEAITRQVNGKTHESYEHLTLDTRNEYLGALSQELAARHAQMINMKNDESGNLRLEYKISTRGLIGFGSFMMTATRGNGVMSSQLMGYEPMGPAVRPTRMGCLVSAESGEAVTYGLNNAQKRGMTFIEPGEKVYEGMVVGIHSRDKDLVVNICKEKKMTNIRSSTSDFAIHLVPPLKYSLEQFMDFISEDELLEVTPKNLRVRKKILGGDNRYRAGRSGSSRSQEYART
ncbi:MAG: translational GTPase TypA [Dehalococcoidia bacterium]|nr:translational GTPase TypA [Dehalococcoidia bacterium]